MQSDGVDVSALEISVEKEFRKRSSQEKLNSGRFWSMFYTIPTYHNPTGTLMSSEKCKKVVEIARKYDLVIESLSQFRGPGEGT
jgi:DNA-binding transcriptional MocR family regulator